MYKSEFWKRFLTCLLCSVSFLACDDDNDDSDASKPDACPGEEDCDGSSQYNRTCGVELVYFGGSQPYVAGEFNNWSATATPMTSVGNNEWRVTLTTRDHGLTSSSIVGYKLVVNGEWLFDPKALHYKTVGEGQGRQLNSAFLVPNCALPEVEMETITTSPDGSYSTNVTVWQDIQGHQLQEVKFFLDGTEIQPSDHQEGNRYQISGHTQTGRHVLKVRVKDADGDESEPVSSVFWIEENPFDWRDTALYMFMIDRFANGDRNNDNPNTTDNIPYANNWHGGDLQGAQRVLESGYFESLGVKAIWLSPVNQQTLGAWDEFMSDDKRNGLIYGGHTPVIHKGVGFHGYWPISGSAVEARFGGEEALRNFIQAAHKRGIRVLLDLVVNHVHQDHEYYRQHRDWFRTACIFTQNGCDWTYNALEGLFAPYLPDINWTEPEADQQFISDAMDWIENYGFDGFRVDAVKHVETNAVLGLRAALHRRFEQGGTRMPMFGETAIGAEGKNADGSDNPVYGYQLINSYVGEDALDGQFDFPTHHKVSQILLTGEGNFRDVEDALKKREENYKPDSLHVAFLGSHDECRMVTRSANDTCNDWSDYGAMATQPAEDYVYRNLRIAWTYLMTTPYIPLIYAGDEVALPGGNDPDNRRNMIWDSSLSDLSMSSDVPNEQQLEVLNWIRALAKLRSEHPALTRGNRRELYISDDKYVYARYTADECILIVLNRGANMYYENLDLSLVGWSGQSAQTLEGPASSLINGDKITIYAPEHSISILQVKR